MVNIDKLNKELTTSEIEFAGCNSSGIVWGVDGVTEIQNRADVAAIISAHDPDNSWGVARDKRNKLLFDCDWTQLQDAVLTTQEKLAWSTYRQTLRNITEDYAEADDIVWPQKPNG